jgi:hypothetical protein
VEPVPVDKVPVEGDWAEAGVVLVPGWVLDVEPPGVPVAGVVPVVPVVFEPEVPSVVPSVEESLGGVVPSAEPIRPAPPVVVTAEIPPVDNGPRFRIVVVVVVDCFVLAAVESEFGVDSPTAGVTGAWVRGITICVWLPAALEAEDMLEAGCAAGLEVGLGAAARA